jgi:hypothetical protein
MLPIKKRNNEIKRGRQKKGLFTDVLWILKTEQGLSRILDWKDIDRSEFGKVHRQPLMKN